MVAVGCGVVSSVRDEGELLVQVRRRLVGCLSPLAHDAGAGVAVHTAPSAEIWEETGAEIGAEIGTEVAPVVAVHRAVGGEHPRAERGRRGAPLTREVVDVVEQSVVDEHARLGALGGGGW